MSTSQNSIFIAFLASALLCAACDGALLDASGVGTSPDGAGSETGTIGVLDFPEEPPPQELKPGCSADGQCAIAEGKLDTCLRPFCDLQTGLCAIGPAVDGKVCDDGEICSLQDSCEAGVCKGGKKDKCNDDNMCTADGCQMGVGCQHEPLDGACDDGDQCTVKDVCEYGVCVGSAPADCSDTDPCTLDTCETELGCVHSLHAGPCDDGDACTEGDTCAGGSCLGSPVTCVDQVACTTDLCDAKVGCAFLPDATLCDDQDGCTTDICDVAQGCLHMAQADGTPCDDQDACTEGEFCQGGACFGTAVVCDSTHICLDPICDPVIGCTTTPNAAWCDDGDVCTYNDQCVGGACSGTWDPACGGPTCGDGLCSGGETCNSCSLDCGPCGGGNTGDCCTEKSWPGCSNANIQACVCSVDSYCCSTAWDSLCVSEVETECGYTCQGGGGLCGLDMFNTCLGACGGSSIFGFCYCDSVCESLGDCCSDFYACCW